MVLTNSWSGAAFTDIARKVAEVVLRAKSPANFGDAAAVTARARALYDQLRRGELDRSQLTDNLAYYFTPQVRQDFQQSLAALGEPTGFTAEGEPGLRGGFVTRRFKVNYPGRTLSISAFTEMGAAPRFEQFLVNPE